MKISKVVGINIDYERFEAVIERGEIIELNFASTVLNGKDNVEQFIAFILEAMNVAEADGESN